MGAAIIGVAGVLLGGLLQFVISDWRARTDRRRQALAATAGSLLGSLATLREHQYAKIRTRRLGESDTREAWAARYAARTAVTTARGALRLAVRDAALLSLAHQAVGAAFALGDAADADVQTAGDAAREAHDRFENAAARLVHGQH